MNPLPMPEAVLAPLRTRWSAVLDDPATFRFQILLTVPAAGGDRTYGLRAGAEYYFPASTVKPSAVMACLAMLDGRLPEAPGCRSAPAGAGIGIDTPFSIRTRDGTCLHRDADGPLTVARLARKVCVISDNPAYNILFDLAGRSAIAWVLEAIGVEGARVRQHVGAPRRGVDFGPVPQARFRTTHGSVTLPAVPAGPESPDDRPPPGLLVGRSWREDGRREDAPMDFRERNRLPLAGIHRVMMAVDPEGFASPPGPLPMTAESAAFLRSLLTMPPRESPDPVFPPDAFPDDYAKFLLPGLERVVPQGLSVCSKCGRAYGFTIDSAVVRAPGRAPFALSAVVHTNANGVLGDDLYEYAELANPLMNDLAESAARWAWSEPRA